MYAYRPLPERAIAMNGQTLRGAVGRRGPPDTLRVDGGRACFPVGSFRAGDLVLRSSTLVGICFASIDVFRISIFVRAGVVSELVSSEDGFRSCFSVVGYGATSLLILGGLIDLRPA